MNVSIQLNDHVSITVDIVPTLSRLSDEELLKFEKEIVAVIKKIKKDNNKRYVSQR